MVKKVIDCKPLKGEAGTFENKHHPGAHDNWKITKWKKSTALFSHTTILNTPHHFPPSNFTYSWTLFSKFFSSFPHGTCSLSVSTLYLALGDLYLPLQAAISSNPTLRTHVDTLQTPRAQTGLSPSLVDHSKSLSLGCSRTVRLYTTTRLRFPNDPIFNLGFSRFTRRYWGNRSFFLFLPLIICLNSGGLLAPIEIDNFLSLVSPTKKKEALTF